jgi:hypothetical protein
MKRVGVAFCVATILLLATAVQAHRVNVFAWVEDGVVRIEGTMGGEQKAKNSELKVLDAATEEVLLTGHTDQEGLFSFPLPAEMGEAGLRIVLEAGPGHRAEWLLEAKEMETTQGNGPKSVSGPGLLQVVVGLAVIFGLASVILVMLKTRKIRG